MEFSQAGTSVPTQERNDFPRDVQAFIKHRDACDHFRGEEPYDKERQIYLIKMMKQLCTGTDIKLNNLKWKYKNQSKVLLKLNAYEADIEAQ